MKSQPESYSEIMDHAELNQVIKVPTELHRVNQSDKESYLYSNQLTNQWKQNNKDSYRVEQIQNKQLQDIIYVGAESR